MLKENMQQIQLIIYKYLTSDDPDSLGVERAKVMELKKEIFSILNDKFEREWNKQKSEVDGQRYLIKYPKCNQDTRRNN